MYRDYPLAWWSKPYACPASLVAGPAAAKLREIFITDNLWLSFGGDAACELVRYVTFAADQLFLIFLAMRMILRRETNGTALPAEYL
jgi:hypothetical protein